MANQILALGDDNGTFYPQADFMVTAHGTLNTNVRIYCMPLKIYKDTRITDKTPLWTELDPNEFLSESGGKTLQFRFGSGYICEARATAVLTGNARVYWTHIRNDIRSLRVD